MIIIFFEYVNDSLKMHLLNTPWVIFTEYFEKILQVDAWQQQNKYLYLKINNCYITPKQMAQLNCTLYDTNGVWFSHIAVVVVFQKLSE